MKVDFDQVFYDCDLPVRNNGAGDVWLLPEGFRDLPNKPVLSGVSRTVPEWMRRAVLERDGHRCVCCASTRYLEIDHMWPVRHGGWTALDNLCCLCRSCNRAKSSWTPWCVAQNEWGDACLGDLAPVGDELRCSRCSRFWNIRAIATQCFRWRGDNL